MKTWEKRHDVYERRYARSVFRGLRALVLSYPALDPSELENSLKRLYLGVMPNESKLAWNEFVEPVTGVQVKDFFDELARVSAPEDSEEISGFWAVLFRNYLVSFLAVRIGEMVNTTRKYLSRLNLEAKEEEERKKALRDFARTQKPRADKITRTETTNAMNKAQFVALESSKLPYEKAWVAMRDERTRIGHFLMNPLEFIPANEPFIVSGERLQYPGDVSLGASPWNVINCRCHMKFRVRGNPVAFRPKQ